MRAVLDTNVLLSAMFTPGVCEVLLDVCLVADDVELILSEHILTEFHHHGTNKFGAPAEKVEAATTLLRQRCELVEPAAVPSEAFEDPADLPVLGTAIASRADCLVTGDRKLLALKTYHGVALLSPRAFFDRLR